MILKHCQVTIGNSQFESSEIFVFKNGSLSLYLIISASGDDVFIKIRQSASLVEEDFASIKSFSSDLLKLYLNEIKKSLLGLNNLEILLTVVRDNTIFIEQTGQFEGYLLRGKSLIEILAPTASNLISGQLLDQDRLLFIYSNQELSLNINELINLSIENFDEDLVSLAHDKTNLFLSAILLCFASDSLDKTFTPELFLPRFLPRILKYSHSLFNKLSQKLKVSSAKAKLVVVIFILGLILIGFNFVKLYRQKSAQNKQFLSFYTQAENKLNQAKQLKDTDPSQAKDNYLQAKEALELAFKVKPNDSKAQRLRKEIDQS